MTTTDQAIETTGAGQYADVNGINLYYETHGTGRPIVLLHGGLGSGEMFGPLLPALAAGHHVIVPDLQGHGRTADIDRPIDVRLMGDDIAALIGHLGLGQPDVVGYSLGGGVAFFTAVRHPEAVGRLVMVSTNIRRNAIYPEMLAQQLQMAVGKYQSMEAMFPPSHAVEAFELLDGGQRDGGWMGEGRPAGGHALAIVPGVTHYNVCTSPALAAAVLSFIDAPAA